jgi:TolB-like protein
MSFLAELKRRNVIRVGLAYGVIGWVLAQIAEFAFENFGAPDWALKTFVVVILLGLPLALLFAWAFEMTPEGIKREKDIDRSQSITVNTGRKLDFVIIAVLVVAVGFLLVDKFFIESASEPDEIVATAGRQSIAVLPFVNMSDDSDHFADGLSEELLNLLAKIPDLKVAGRTSSFAFKGRNEDLREIGEALDVQHVLEGSVRRSGSRLRITAQLIKVDDGFHVWSETYDREMADIFDIQDDVSGSITDALKIQFASPRERQTENVDAYALYLRALALENSSEEGNNAKGIELLDQAIALDRNFARAYELKARFYWFSAAWTIDGPVAQLKAYDAAMRALELDPTLTSARSFATTADPENWTWIGEIQALEEFVKVEPESVSAIGGLLYDLILVGYFDEAIALADRFIELEPLALEAYWRKGEALMAAGRREEARVAFLHSTGLGGAVSAPALAGDFLLSGEDEAAIKILETFTESRSSEFSLADPRTFIESVRDPVNGKAYLDKWIADSVTRATNVNQRVLPYSWYLYLGYLDDYWHAIDLFDDPDSAWTNTDALEYAGIMSFDSGYRQHPRYLERARSVGTIDLWEQRGPPDHCSKASGDWVCK